MNQPFGDQISTPEKLPIIPTKIAKVELACWNQEERDPTLHPRHHHDGEEHHLGLTLVWLRPSKSGQLEIILSIINTIIGRSRGVDTCKGIVQDSSNTTSVTLS